MRKILLSSVVLLVVATPALATPFSVTSDTVTSGQSVTGTDAGSIAAGASLVTSGDAIQWSGPSAAPGVVITNEGTIRSTGNRGIDTSGGNTTRNLTFTNTASGTLWGDGDAFRIDSDVENSTVEVNNYGTIRSDTGQALDFNAIESSTATVRINNQAGGIIEAAEADAVRPGQGAEVTNAGIICAGAVSGGVCSGGIPDESNDGVDWQEASGRLLNQTGGVISGQRHGTTSDTNVDVTNQAGALIEGRNGSGVGSDGDGTVVNHGTITGAWNGVAADGDGDGVDIDYLADITNFGTIEGQSAHGQKDGQANGAEGLAIGGGTIDNKSAASIYGAQNGILVDDSEDGNAHYATTLTNAGDIEGDSGYGVRFVGERDDIVTNSGHISGVVAALDMGGGDDQLTLKTGATFTGLVDGGAGDDTLTVDGSVLLGDIMNVEELIMETGAVIDLSTDLHLDRVIGILVSGGAITNIMGNGHNIFYTAADPANAYLGGRTLQLAQGGMLRAVGEPGTLALFLPMLLGAATMRRRP